MAHCKLLIRKRLWVFQFAAELPSFRQAADWMKWETLWAICATPYGTGIALEASKLSKEYTRRMRKPRNLAAE
jgi:hypothetical protein